MQDGLSMGQCAVIARGTCRQELVSALLRAMIDIDDCLLAIHAYGASILDLDGTSDGLKRSRVKY